MAKLCVKSAEKHFFTKNIYFFLVEVLVVYKKSVILHRFNRTINCITLKNLNKMKKLVFVFAAFAAVSFASCGGNTTTEATNDSIAADTVVVDSAAQDTVAQDTVAQDTVQA